MYIHCLNLNSYPRWRCFSWSRRVICDALVHRGGELGLHMIGNIVAVCVVVDNGPFLDPKFIKGVFFSFKE